MMNGRILRIEKLSCYDGDGLRTVVFLKGCPLRCAWCSTPESHHQHTDFGVQKERCTRCFTCIETCPNGAISFHEESASFTTDRDRCDDCGHCISGCLPGARSSYGYTASVESTVKEVAKDSLFYMHSGGGVTISGGEPFTQTEFLCSLLENCMMLGINTAIETSGYTSYVNMEKALPFVDTLFYDLKHMDVDIHREITGVRNDIILGNLLKADRNASHLSLIVRMPVIPNINDSDENVLAMGRFCKKLKKLREIQLLPYHRLGIETYKRLALPYSLEHVPAYDHAELKNKAALLTKMGIPTRIGS